MTAHGLLNPSPLGAAVLSCGYGVCLMGVRQECPLQDGPLTPTQISIPPSLVGFSSSPFWRPGHLGLNPTAPPSLPTNDTLASPRDGTLAKNSLPLSGSAQQSCHDTRFFCVCHSMVLRAWDPQVGQGAEGQHPASLSLRPKQGPRGGAQGHSLASKGLWQQHFTRH